MKGARSWKAAWQVLTLEGPGSLIRRLRDRKHELRRRRSFRLLGSLGPEEAGFIRHPPLPEIAILNLLPSPPRPDWGGVAVQLLARLDAEAENRPLALLYPAREGYRLEIRDLEKRHLVRIWASSPPALLPLRDAAFESAVDRALDLLGASTLHVEQVLGLPFESLRRLAGRGRNLVISLQDFGLFCLRPHLLERPRDRFCDFSQEDERCLSCLRVDWQVGMGFQRERRAAGATLLEAACLLLFPSEYLRSAYATLYPDSQARCEVVAPASPPAGDRRDGISERPALGHRRAAGRHIAWAGSLQTHKGAAILRRLIEHPTLRARGVRWSVFGGGDPRWLRELRARPDVRVYGYYRVGTLPGLLVAGRVDLALHLSIVPESYGLTADECLAAGVPVLALDHGAVAERLRRLRTGWCVPPDATIDVLAEEIGKALDSGPAAVPRHIRQALPDVEQAARKVLRLYDDLHTSQDSGETLGSDRSAPESGLS